MTAVETVEHIIRRQSTEQLVPFLLSLPKEDVIEIRQKTKALDKELSEFKDLGGGRWGSKITTEQRMMLFLSGLKTYSRKEALGRDFMMWRLEPKHEAAFWTILEDARPAWLLDWLLRWAESGSWRLPEYPILREMERRQLIRFQPKLFATALSGVLSEMGTRISQSGNLPANALAAIANELRKDDVLLQRDLPLIFDFDGGAVYAQARVQQPMPATGWGGNGPWNWQAWEKLHPTQNVGWRELLVELTNSGHLDRADILTRCLLALRRDFRRPLLTWFKELFLSLQPALAERLARQAELLELLAHPTPLVANFAIEQLKDMWPEPGFDLAPLLLYADNLLTRQDLKTGLKTLLAGLAKLPKQNVAHTPAVARLLTAALAHADNAVQERAAKGLADILKAKTPLLTTTETRDAVSAIGDEAELLGAPARLVLAPWLPAIKGPAQITGAAEIYTPSQGFIPDISAATAIVPVADWHELLFLTGQVLQHNDPTATERWLDGLLRLNGQWPAGFAGQLRPYLAQLFPEIKKASEAEVAAILSGPIDVYSHEGLVQAMLLTWATGFKVARVESVNVTRPHAIPNPLLAIDKQRYLLAEALLAGGRALPLLSTPTHQPHWVAPSALVARLLAYESADVMPESADLAIALARTAHSHPTETTEALRLLPQLRHPALRALLGWFLNPADLPLPAPANPPANRKAAGLQSTLDEAMPELWVVAARTKAPTRAFPTLPALLGYDGSNIAQPQALTLDIMPRENSYQELHKPGQPTIVHRWAELAWNALAPASAPSPLLLYSLPSGKVRHNSWEHNMLLVSNFPFLISLLPNNPAPVYEYALRSAAWADNLEASERDTVAQALRSMLGAGPSFEGASLGLLASGLVHHTPLCRSLAQEIVVRAIAQGRLEPVLLGQILGRQLGSGYAPVQRLADHLAQLRAIDAVTDDAVRQMLEALLPELPAESPRGLGKLLETYADLTARSSCPVPAPVQTQLRAWSTKPALKKLAGSLL